MTCVKNVTVHKLKIKQHKHTVCEDKNDAR